MSQEFIYYFDDLEIVKGLAIYASGEARISYNMAPPDREVGIFSSYVTDIDVMGIKINGSGQKDEDKILDRKEWLYNLVEQALINSSRVEQACLDDYND
jgi:hypothetical protein